jgi:hypothetical protein
MPKGRQDRQLQGEILLLAGGSLFTNHPPVAIAYFMWRPINLELVNRIPVVLLAHRKQITWPGYEGQLG